MIKPQRASLTYFAMFRRIVAVRLADSAVVVIIQIEGSALLDTLMVLLDYWVGRIDVGGKGGKYYQEKGGNTIEYRQSYVCDPVDHIGGNAAVEDDDSHEHCHVGYDLGGGGGLGERVHDRHFLMSIGL